jgi:hypothetical protein
MPYASGVYKLLTGPSGSRRDRSGPARICRRRTPVQADDSGLAAIRRQERAEVEGLVPVLSPPCQSLPTMRGRRGSQPSWEVRRQTRRPDRRRAVGPHRGREPAVKLRSTTVPSGQAKSQLISNVGLHGATGPYMACKRLGRLRSGLFDLVGLHIGLHRPRPGSYCTCWPAVIVKPQAWAAAVSRTAAVLRTGADQTSSRVIGAACALVRGRRARRRPIRA